VDPLSTDPRLSKNLCYRPSNIKTSINLLAQNLIVKRWWNWTQNYFSSSDGNYLEINSLELQKNRDVTFCYHNTNISEWRRSLEIQQRLKENKIKEYSTAFWFSCLFICLMQKFWIKRSIDQLMKLSRARIMHLHWNNNNNVTKINIIKKNMITY